MPATRIRRLSVAALVVALTLSSALVEGQAPASIVGLVSDTSGAPLPGVTVEVAGPALTGGSRSLTTDGGGLYRVTDLPPGVYFVKFLLTGFKTVNRNAINLASNVETRLDVKLAVAEIVDTILFSHWPPIVDVQSAAHLTFLDRSNLDIYPSGRTLQSLAQLMAGVSLSAPDVAGSAGAMQTYMSMRGGFVSAANNLVVVDGLPINGLMLDGAVQTYINDGHFVAANYQTSGIGAERSSGGVIVNLEPRQSGNRFRGSLSGFHRPGGLQADNYSARFRQWGLPLDGNGEPAISRVKRISDVTLAQGGPIRKNTLWFFGSVRDFQPVNTVPNTFLDGGAQGIDDNYIRTANVRLTYQLGLRQNASVFYDRVFKWRGHDMSGGTDPETAALVWMSPNYSTLAAKYTWLPSSRSLVEGGFSQNAEYYRNLFLPGVLKPRGSPDWFSTASHASSSGGALSVAPRATAKEFPVSKVAQASVAYVTTSHHIKVGASLRWGSFLHGSDGNADLQQTYPDSAIDQAFNIRFPTSNMSPSEFAQLFPSRVGRPCTPTNGETGCSVTIQNSPRASRESLTRDLGLYIQDSFMLRRLTLNGGIRYEMLQARVDESVSEAGRFVPARAASGRTNVPDWKDWAPRFEAVYDVFGSSTTAVKYSFNRYNEAVTTSVAAAANPMGLSLAVRDWTDLNADDIAQGGRTWTPDGTAFTDCVYLTPGCEINLSGSATQSPLAADFGLVRDTGSIASLPRRYRLEHGLEIQQGLSPWLVTSGTYYHATNRNLTKTVNLARVDDGTLGTQYRKVDLFNPIDGTPYVYFNAIAGIPFDNVTSVEPLRKSVNDTFIADLKTRPIAGSQVSASLEFTRTLSRNCGTSAVKRDGSPAVVDPNEARFCDDWNLAKPFDKNFKFVGFFQVVRGVVVGIVYQNLDGGRLDPSFRYGRGFDYPDGTGAMMLGGASQIPACPTAFGCVAGAATVPATWIGPAEGTTVGKLVAPGTVADERLVQLDVKVSKRFLLGRVHLQPAVEVFNLMNADHVQSRSSFEYANRTGTYLTPSSNLQGRIVGLGVGIEW